MMNAAALRLLVNNRISEFVFLHLFPPFLYVSVYIRVLSACHRLTGVVHTSQMTPALSAHLSCHPNLLCRANTCFLVSVELATAASMHH